MAFEKIRISNIFGGLSETYNFQSQVHKNEQFLASLGIDPDLPRTDASTDKATSGVLRPSAYAKFSSTNVTGAVIAIITNPKDTNVYTVQTNGKLVSYSSSLGSETLAATAAGNNCTGAAYYNNYIYLFGTGVSKNDVSRYGPLDGTPALTDAVWTGSTLGSQTALKNPTYPSTRNSVAYPSHWAHFHVSSNKLFFGDFLSAIAGNANSNQGLIHYIKTKNTTNDGDTNNGSTYGALALPLGYMPYDIQDYGTQLVIAASQTTNSTVDQGDSLLIFWDTVSSLATRFVKIPEPITSALRYQNGILYGWSGYLGGGVRFWRYLGGDSIQTLFFVEEGHPPMAGAIASAGNRVMWGAFTTYPANSAGVYAYGSKSDLLPRGVHHIALSSVTATSSNGVVTALEQGLQGASGFPPAGAYVPLLIAGTDGTNFNIDKPSTTYNGTGQTQYWRSKVFNIGSTFHINRLSLRFQKAIAANMTITPTIYLDDEANTTVGTTINNTNYPNSDLYVTIMDFTNSTEGKNNFYLELKWTGSALLPVDLPIQIDIEVYENDKL